MAVEWQATAQSAGVLLIWTITTGTSDHGDYYVARPREICEGGGPLPVYLLADTLNELRDMLPPGLTCLSRQVDDETIIVESWL